MNNRKEIVAFGKHFISGHHLNAFTKIIVESIIGKDLSKEDESKIRELADTYSTMFSDVIFKPTDAEIETLSEKYPILEIDGEKRRTDFKNIAIKYMEKCL